MPEKKIFKQWWAILFQGIFLIVLSILIFNNPGAVLTAIALWLGVVLMIAGLAGIIAWLTDLKEDREFLFLLGSIVQFIVGILMITRMIVTIKAITIVFGLLVIVVGMILMSAGWNARHHLSMWWLAALLGIAASLMGIKSIVDISSGVQHVNNFIATCVLIAGIGLVAHAFLRKAGLINIRNKIAGIEKNLHKELNG